MNSVGTSEKLVHSAIKRLEQPLGDGAGAATNNPVVPHSGPFDVRSHQAEGAGGVTGGELDVEARGRSPSGWLSSIDLAVANGSALGGLGGREERAPRGARH